MEKIYIDIEIVRQSNEHKDILKEQGNEGKMSQICNKLWKTYTSKQWKTAKQPPVSHNSVILRKYRCGRKSTKTYQKTNTNYYRKVILKIYLSIQ